MLYRLGKNIRSNKKITSGRKELTNKVYLASYQFQIQKFHQVNKNNFAVAKVHIKLQELKT